MIPLLALDAVTLRRRPAPTLDASGRVVHGAPVDTVIQGSVQPAAKTAHTWLPDALRGTRTVRVISYAELQGVDGDTPPDRIVYDAEEYEVHTVERLPGFLGQPPHWEAYAARVSALEGAP